MIFAVWSQETRSSVITEVESEIAGDGDPHESSPMYPSDEDLPSDRAGVGHFPMRVICRAGQYMVNGICMNWTN